MPLTFPVTIVDPCGAGHPAGDLTQLRTLLARFTGDVATLGGLCAQSPTAIVRCTNGREFTCPVALALFANTVREIRELIRQAEEPPPPDPTPCTDGPGSEFVAGPPTCVALRDDMRSAILPFLPAGLVGPTGSTGLPGAVGTIGPVGTVGSIGPRGFVGPTGLSFPTSGTDFGRLLGELAVSVSRIFDAGGRATSSLPASPPTLARSAVQAVLSPQTVTFETVKPGGTVQSPVIVGSSDDPLGQQRPVFADRFVPKPSPAPPGTPSRVPFPGAGFLRLALWLFPFLERERHRDFLRDSQRRAAADRRAEIAQVEQLLRRLQMPFGQMGFMGGQSSGGTGFLDALPAILQAATPLALGVSIAIVLAAWFLSSVPRLTRMHIVSVFALAAVLLTVGGIWAAVRDEGEVERLCR